MKVKYEISLQQRFERSVLFGHEIERFCDQEYIT